jgi:hypothetical protein
MAETLKKQGSFQVSRLQKGWRTTHIGIANQRSAGSKSQQTKEIAVEKSIINQS